ncbi:MAG: hypothetical protein ACHQ50_04960 [Fimbriimonadales bacterium]
MGQGWICPTCGEIAQGELCTHCGKARGPQGPVGPAPGSYLSLLGYRSSDVWKPVGFILLLITAATGTLFVRSVFLIVDGFLILAFLPSAILSLRLLWARRRARR